MEYRIATEADFDSVRRLWAYSFNGDEPFATWYFSNYYNPDNALGCWKNGRLQAVLHLHPYQLFLRGRPVDVSYIVGVATDPTARREGLTGSLLSKALAEMNRRNRPLSILMPFKAGFYYPYEWRLCYHHLKFSLQLEDLRSVAKPSGEFRPAGLADAGLLDLVYRCFVADKHGYVVRSLTDWQHLLSEHSNDQGHIYLLESNGRPAGYIMYVLRDGKIIVRELAYCDISAQQALLDFLYGHRSHAQAAEWNDPLDTQDKTLFSLFEAKQDIRVFPFMSARIVNVEQILTHCLYPSGNWSVDLTVADKLAPWNEQSYNLSIEDGQAKVKLLESSTETKISVGALTQLVIGRLSAKELARHGELECSDQALLALTELFPRCENYINEYY